MSGHTPAYRQQVSHGNNYFQLNTATDIVSEVPPVGGTPLHALSISLRLYKRCQHKVADPCFSALAIALWLANHVPRLHFPILRSSVCFFYVLVLLAGIALQGDFYKTFETCPVNNLKFQLIIREIIQALYDEGFEQYQLTEWRSSSFQ